MQTFSPITYPSKGIRWLLCEYELVTILVLSGDGAFRTLVLSPHPPSPRFFLGRRFLGRRFLGHRFLGRRFLGPCFLGRRFLDTPLLGQFKQLKR